MVLLLPGYLCNLYGKAPYCSSTPGVLSPVSVFRLSHSRCEEVWVKNGKGGKVGKAYQETHVSGTQKG